MIFHRFDVAWNMQVSEVTIGAAGTFLPNAVMLSFLPNFSFLLPFVSISGYVVCTRFNWLLCIVFLFPSFFFGIIGVLFF